MSKLTDYRDSVKRIKELCKSAEKICRATAKDINTLEYDVYRDKIHAIEKERDDKINLIKAKKDAEIAKLDKEIEEQRVVVKEVERIYNLIDVYRDNLKEPFKPEVCLYTYSDRDEQGNYISDRRKVTLEAFATLGLGKYIASSVYVAENGKPVNKYTLVVAFSTIFNQDVFKTNWSYIHNINKEHGTVMIPLKEGPDKDKLIEWYRKNGLPKDVQDRFNEHASLEKAYDEAIKLYDSKEWKKGYLQWKKKYYEEDYSHGIETPEYKAICEELNNL
jgi:phosphoglycolate phosphatase-like HAD superfamily hydrolase